MYNFVKIFGTMGIRGYFPYVFAFVVLAVFIIFRRSLKLFFFKTVFGKFSPQYVNQYRKEIDSNPHPRATKSELIEHIGLLRELHGIPECQTQVPISFGKFSSGKKEINIIKDVGEPDYFTLRELGNYVVQIFGYDVSIFDKSAMALYFVYKNTLFLGEYIIGREGQKVDAENIFVPLLKKYCPDYVYKSEDRLLLKDGDGTQILIMDDGFAVHLKYFNFRNNDVLEMLFAEQEKIRGNFQSQLFQKNVEL